MFPASCGWSLCRQVKSSQRNRLMQGCDTCCFGNEAGNQRLGLRPGNIGRRRRSRKRKRAAKYLSLCCSEILTQHNLIVVFDFCTNTSKAFPRVLCLCDGTSGPLGPRVRWPSGPMALWSRCSGAVQTIAITWRGSHFVRDQECLLQ
jgi:hypothetical protein